MVTRRALLAVAASLPFAGCTAAAPFRVGYQKNGLLLAAKGRGAVEAALKGPVAWRDFPSGPPLLEAMSLGEIDFGGAGDAPPLFAQAAGARVVYVAAQPVSGSAAAIVVPKGSRFATVTDLRGAKVAYTRGSSAERFVRRALAQSGLTVADIAPVNLTPTQAATAFAAGAVDAWAIWDPFLAHAEVELGARQIVGGRGLARSTSFLLANADVAARAAATLTATLDALVATAAWAAAHRDGLAALIAASGVAPAVANRIAGRQELSVVPLSPAIVATQQRIADDLSADGQLPERVSVAAAMWHGWRGR